MNQRMPVILGLLAGLLANAAWAQERSWYQQTEYKGQEIGKLTGSIYYARMDDYLSVFMVTPEGIILVEPIGTEFATWLKGEMTNRFHVPVKYVIYSHSHWDHASGGAVYADTARFIGQENILKNLANIPPNARPPVNMQKPDLTYTERLNINLGGKRVEVISMPTAHADDNSLVRFVDGTNVLFASDWITVHRLPFGPISPDEIPSVKAVEAINFEYFVCSHGKLGKKEDVTLNRRYREELRDAVAKAIAGAQTLEQAQASVLMENYKEWEFYQQQRPQNVAGTYRGLAARAGQ
ncbi:MAG: MBL fold metallo-hydrolase [Acidobacteriia bacterium]|nr:MBL fold metallo-hydrolase [Terriglobia bacterium]